MEILILEIVFKFVALAALAALIIGAFVMALVCWAYYVCSKDETERTADKNE